MYVANCGCEIQMTVVSDRCYCGPDDYCGHLDEPFVDDIYIVTPCLEHNGNQLAC